MNHSDNKDSKNKRNSDIATEHDGKLLRKHAAASGQSEAAAEKAMTIPIRTGRQLL